MISIHKHISGVRSFIKKMDWKLLIFLVLFLNVKIIIKVLALIFIYLLRPDFKFGFRKVPSRLPVFYIIVLVIGVIDFFLYAGYGNANYTLVFFTGSLFWIFCILAVHQVKLSVERSPSAAVHRTVFVFFMLNLLVSVINLLRINIEIGEWNPYIYQGMYQKYFIGTGDYIKGISFDTSTTNAILNVFGVFYFLTRKHFMLAIFCMIALLLTCSNFINISIIGVFLYCFIFQSSREQKSIIIVCVMLLVLFMAKISPQNNAYAIKTAQNFFSHQVVAQKNAPIVRTELKPDSILSTEEKKYKFARLYLDSVARVALVEKKTMQGAFYKPVIIQRPTLPVANIHSIPFQHKQDSSESRLQVIRLAIKLGKDTSLSNDTFKAGKSIGKLIAIKQSIRYLQKNPAKLITGTGMGNFSSKLAFRTTGLQGAGGYPRQYVYINNDFKENNLAIFLDFFGKDSGFHSISNSPNSVYVQMVTEYGIAGLVSLFAFYLWFFAKTTRKNSYAVPILLIVAGVFFVDYWFEQLSILVLFELLMFLDQKDTLIKQEDDTGR